MLRTLITTSLSVSLLTAAATGALAGPALGPPPVVGGERVPPGELPEVVAVLGEFGACTGTLIAPDVVLTAGHCIDIEPREVITHTDDYGERRGDRIRVKWAQAYPRWEDRFDVGVLMLDHVARPAPRAIASACHANSALAAGTPLRVVGFGLTTPDAHDTNTAKHQATIPVLDPFCETAPGCGAGAAPRGEFAAGGRGTDSCFGDSGGPALLDTPDGPVVVGVVSRGLAVPGAPCSSGGIYVRADKVVAWVERVTGRNIARTTCAGRADAPGPDADGEAGGCSAGGAAGLAAGFVLIGVRRRRRPQITPKGA